MSTKKTIINVKYEAPKVGLKISERKMKVMIFERGISNYGAYVIESEEYSRVNKSVYLGSTSSADGHLHKEVKARTGKASGVFQNWPIFGKIRKFIQDKDIRCYCDHHIVTWQKDASGEYLVSAGGIK